MRRSPFELPLHEYSPWIDVNEYGVCGEAHLSDGKASANRTRYSGPKDSSSSITTPLSSKFIRSDGRWAAVSSGVLRYAVF